MTAPLARRNAEQASIEAYWAAGGIDVGAIIGWLDWEAEKWWIEREQRRDREVARPPWEPP